MPGFSAPLLRPLIEAARPQVLIDAAGLGPELVGHLLRSAALADLRIHAVGPAAQVSGAFGDQLVRHSGSASKLLRLRAADVVVLDADTEDGHALPELASAQAPGRTAIAVVVLAPARAPAAVERFLEAATGRWRRWDVAEDGFTVLTSPRALTRRPALRALLELLGSEPLVALQQAFADEHARALDEVARLQTALEETRHGAAEAARTATDEASALRRQVRDLEDALNDRSAAVLDAEGQRASLQDELTRQAGVRDEHRRELDRAEAEQAELNRALEARRHELARAEAEQAALERALDDGRRDLAQAQADQAGLAQTLEQARAAEAELVARADDLRDRRRRAERTLTALVESLEVDLGRAATARTELERRLAETEADRRADRERIRSLEQAHADLELHLAVARSDLAAALARGERLAAEVQRLARELGSASARA